MFWIYAFSQNFIGICADSHFFKGRTCAYICAEILKSVKQLFFIHISFDLAILYMPTKVLNALSLRRKDIYGKSIECVFSVAEEVQELKVGSTFCMSTTDLSTELLCEVVDIDDHPGSEKIIVKVDYLGKDVLPIKNYRNLPELIDTVTTEVNEIVYRFEFFPYPHFVFINDAITSLTGYTPEEHYEDYRFIFKYIHPEDKNLVEEILAQGPAEDSEETILRWITKEGQEIVVQHRLEKLVENGKCIGFKGVNTDVTKLQNKVEEVKEVSLVRKLLNEIANRFVNVKASKLDSLINQSIQELAEYVDADRFYLITYDLENLLSSNTHEWCAPGIEPQIDELQNIPVDGIPQWLEAHLNHEILEIPDVLALPKDDNVREILEPQGIKSLITFPVFVAGELFAFVGIDSVKDYHNYTSAEREVLKLFAKLLGNTYEKMRANQKLIETTDFLNELIEQNQSLIYVKDLDGIYLRVNEAWEKTIGLTRERVLGNDDFDLFPDEIARQFKENDHMVLEKGEIINVEEKLSTGENDLRYFITVKFPLKDKEGKIYAISGVSTEITQRKLAQLKIEAGERRFRTLFVESSTPMALINADTGYYADFNPAFQKVYATGELQPKELHITDFSSPKTGYFGDHLMNAKSDGFLTLKQESKSGKIFHVRISGCFIELDGKKLLYEVIFDVSDQVAYENAIVQQNEKLKEIAWEQSHIVRAPLVRTMALIDYFEDEQLLPPEVKADFEQIKKSMEELDQITRGIAIKADKTKVNDSSLK